MNDLSEDDPVGDLTARLQGRLGEDGVYIVRVGPHVDYQYFGGGQDADDFENAFIDAVRSMDLWQHRDDGPNLTQAAQVALIARATTDPEHPPAASEVEAMLTERPWAEPRMDSRDDSDGSGDWILLYLLAATVAMVVFLLGWRVTRSVLFHRNPARVAERFRRPGSVEPRTTTEIDPERLRGETDAALERAATAQAGHPDHPRWDDVETARLCAETLRSRASSEHDEDPRNVVGAWVLAQAAAAMIEDQRLSVRCFAHPLHPGKARPERIPLPSGRTVEVPLCSQCLRHGVGSDPLRAPDRRPYFEHDDVWADTGFGALDPEPWHAVSRSLR